MDLHQFLSLERMQLQSERQRLSGDNKSNNNCDANNADQTCPAALLMQTANYVPAQCHHSASNECNEPTTKVASSSLATANQNCKPSTPRSHTVYAAGKPEAECAARALAEDELHLDLTDLQESQLTTMRKSAKEMVNQRELLVGSARNYKSPNVSPRKSHSERPLSENRLPIRRSNAVGDDMEQWVTDTFYSYFPGFNNENQKRQNYLRERQRENQQNLLRHQMLHPTRQKHATNTKQQVKTTTITSTARSAHSNSSTTNSTTDKTDLELIVNSNPNYVPPKTGPSQQQSKLRPVTTRHKLLQDLGHVDLSNIVTGDGIMERNLRSAELETERKKDYQRDLMQQIEEKRRSIEMLREKERKEEEALTRRLQNQLKTMQLEEQLERERLRVENARADSEHNRVMREQLLAKLENDAQLLQAKQMEKNANNLASGPAAARHNNKANGNKVYKYFSNSAHHEYKRGQPLPPAVELDFEIPAMAKIERECFHLCEKICPLCDEPLKSYESCCLRCQRKLALKMKQRKPKPTESNANDAEQQSNEPRMEYEQADSDDDDHYCHSSYALVCLKCERLYALCTTCLAKSDVCRACQRERNVCMNCRRTLCSFCLEEVACGRDTERTHINEQDEADEQQKPQPENAFRVLEVNYAVPAVQETQAASVNSKSDNSPPYSMNIARNSVFHADYKPTPIKQSFVEQLPLASGSANTSFEVDSADEQAMERVRRQTEQRLTRYLENYGDLAKQRSKSESRHRGTQTTPQSTGRRDVVLHEPATHNLSMPLLREMPKMTRKETTLATSSQRQLDNLKKRWEVPAVQKFTISSTSPKILTQVGAIRKQLQAERFFDETDVEGEAEDY